MKIAFCSSEVFPFAKTGGLADVSGALPLALTKKGCRVKVFMPFYKGIKAAKVFDDYGVTHKGGVDFYFIKNNDYFMRQALYGTRRGDYHDNLERFSFFCKAVLKVLKEIEFSPDIIHSNDWQASLVNIYLRLPPPVSDSFFKHTRSILTIHNFAYQGIFEKDKYPLLGIAWEYFNMNCLEFYGKINLLKGGIVFSDMVNTVSPTYAKQIQTPDYGCGLDGILREKRNRFLGILNAIDYEVWDPQRDEFIYRKYCAKSVKGKYVNKRRFQEDLGLDVDRDTLLLGMVSRLTEQKGVDILTEALDYILGKYQVVILGYGDGKYHKLLKKKARKHKGRLSIHLKFDEALAHKIYAACDCFLLPSRFEPCGLSQMVSYRYGTLPIAHHTGGLADTVIEVSKGGGGFVFHKYSSDELISAVERAAEAFKERKAWREVLLKVMRYDYSWEVTADKYIKMYKRCLSLE
ncbi:MAG: glycogen synthase GlgA [Candidatus Omnitrophota bacterium]|nr:MAG: glycogen synthase GlgA [Candidatus Omnitrophota bacterium]